MKQRKARTLALAALLAAGLLLTPAAAANTPEHASEVLYQLGLFQGMGQYEDGTPDFALDEIPTREQAVTMLVRLLGKEAEARAMAYSAPFSDVADWAKPYVAYAYENALTTGTSATSFSGASPVTAAQYLTFVLRALGYSSETDFEWSRAYDFAQELEVIDFGQYERAEDPFTRGDVAIISVGALSAPMKGGAQPLLVFLKELGTFRESKLVLLYHDIITVKKDAMGFAFYPIAGSPNSYQSFTLERVTVNGLPCKISEQYSNNAWALRELPELKETLPALFNYSLLTYDEEAALKAATHHYEPGNGERYPILVFAFEGSGTLPGGETVKEAFAEAIYIQGYS